MNHVRVLSYSREVSRIATSCSEIGQNFIEFVKNFSSKVSTYSSCWCDAIGALTISGLKLGTRLAIALNTGNNLYQEVLLQFCSCSGLFAAFEAINGEALTECLSCLLGLTQVYHLAEPGGARLPSYHGILLCTFLKVLRSNLESPHLRFAVRRRFTLARDNVRQRMQNGILEKSCATKSTAVT